MKVIDATETINRMLDHPFLFTINEVCSDGDRMTWYKEGRSLFTTWPRRCEFCGWRPHRLEIIIPFNAGEVEDFPVEKTCLKCFHVTLHLGEPEDMDS